MTTPRTRRHGRTAATIALAATLGLAACGSGGGGAGSTPTTAPSSAQATTSGGGSSTVSGGLVLPVPSDPITNTATARDLHIDSVLVENNVDATGKAAEDHLEVTVSNSGTVELSGLEVFYVISDPTTGDSENYYTVLPASFTVPAGGSRVIHFDDTGAPDHFPVNRYSLYATSTDALEVKVEVSAHGAAVQTATVDKDAGGAEAPD